MYMVDNQQYFQFIGHKKIGTSRTSQKKKSGFHRPVIVLALHCNTASVFKIEPNKSLAGKGSRRQSYSPGEQTKESKVVFFLDLFFSFPNH